MTQAPPFIEKEFHRHSAPSLFLRALTCQPATEAVAIIHGLGEHSGRYRHVMEALAAQGYLSVTCDLRGHGQSGGQRGHLKHFDDYSEDVSNLLDWAQGTFGVNRPFLLGHSLGGLVALRYASRHAGRLSGVIVSSPALKVYQRIPGWKATLGRGCARWWPSLSLLNEIRPEDLSRDPAVVQGYQTDPLVHRVITARAFVEVMRAMEQVISEISVVALPILFLIGGEDRVVDSTASDEWFQKLEAPDKQWKAYPSCYHELLNEPEKALIFKDVLDWLGRHRPG